MCSFLLRLIVAFQIEMIVDSSLLVMICSTLNDVSVIAVLLCGLRLFDHYLNEPMVKWKVQ